MRRVILLLLVVAPGVIGFIAFGLYALIDYTALQQAYAQFDHATHTSSLNSIMIADARQQMHRINLFAEGVWALLCALIAAIGIHGLCSHHDK